MSRSTGLVIQMASVASFFLIYTALITFGGKTSFQVPGEQKTEADRTLGLNFDHDPGGERTRSRAILYSKSDTPSIQERGPRSILSNLKPSYVGETEDVTNSESNVPSENVPTTQQSLLFTKANVNSVETNLITVATSLAPLEKKPRKYNGPNSSKKYYPMELKDIFISVKTTKIFHKSRLDVIIRTWFKLAPKETYFFTDEDDSELNEQTDGHVINTNCSSSHHRQALCCKMNVEFDTFLKTDKKWFCHFDDDNYVNVPALVKLLRQYSSSQVWYLGKPSTRTPLEILIRDGQQKNITFWFATGGAGFCISRALALKMKPIAGNGKLVEIGDKIRLPDDVTIGYIIEHLLGVDLEVIPQFHSHLESMKFIKTEHLADQITFSYSIRFGEETNVVAITPVIKGHKDPTRFISLHCRLHGCPKMIKKLS